MSATMHQPLSHLRRTWPWAAARPWQTNAGLILLGSAMLAYTHQLIVEFDHFEIGRSGVSGAQVFLYLAAVAIVFLGKSDRLTFPILVTFAIACRMVVLFYDPILSSDVYRYVWDGIVQHAGINPFLYVPADPHLAFLRSASFGDIYPAINRKDYAHTIYPPVAQILFYATTWISPTMTFMKTVMVGFEGLTMWATIQLMRALHIAKEQTVLYLWCPLAIWEFAGSGHLDSVAMAFIALALLFRFKHRPILTGLFLALAVLTKLYPLVLLPALYERKAEGAWKMPATLAATCIAGYAIYLSAGMQVFGFLGGYVQEEGMATGARYFLLELAQHIPGLHNLPSAAFLIFAALIFLALTLWSWQTSSRPTDPNARSIRQKAPFLLPAFALATALMLLFSPHYPWYIAWLIPFLVLIPNLPILTYLCALFYLCTTIIAVGYGPKQYLLNEYLYGWVAAAVLVHVVLRRWPVHRLFISQTP